MPKIHLTSHAIERFVLRHRPDLSLTEARSLLDAGSSTAVRLRSKTFRGQDQWEVQEPKCVLVTKFTTSGIVCVTVLPEPEGRGIPEEELELMREYAMTTPEWTPLCANYKQAEDAMDLLESHSLKAARRQALHEQIIRCETRVGKIWAHISQSYFTAKNRKPVDGNWVKTEAYDHVNAEHKRAVAALRATLRYLVMGESSREEVIREVKHLDPTYLTTAFIAPHTMTKSERKEEILRVRTGSATSLVLPHDLHGDGHSEGDS